MTGKHSKHARHSRRRFGRGAITLTVLLVLVVGTVVGGYVLFGRNEAPTPVAATPHTAHTSPTRPTCARAVQVAVVVTPEVLSAVGAVAADWQRTSPRVNGSCLSADVRAAAPRAAVTQLVSVTRPVVWIPDSSIWAARLSARRPGVVAASTTVATSPLVVVASTKRAGAVRTEAAHGWAALFAGRVPLVIADPARDATGATVTSAAAAMTVRSARAVPAVVDLFMQLRRTTPATQAGGFARVGSGSAFVTSERAALAAGHNDAAAPIYPAGKTPALDYPAVQVLPHGADATETAATAAFARALLTAQAQAQFVRAGLRDRDGSAGAAPTVSLAPPPDARARSTATQLWQAANTPAALLAVMDVSGSMKDPAVHDGPAKIAVATVAATGAVRKMPDDWRVGLWSFSSHEPPADAWTQRVAIAKLTRNRASLLRATGRLRTKTGGDTALYDTVWAAFSFLSRHYDPARVNEVALLTDGADRGPDTTLTLHRLVTKLRHAYRPNRAVHVVALGFGRKADMAALRRIAAATHGRAYRVENAVQIHRVLAESIVAGS